MNRRTDTSSEAPPPRRDANAEAIHLWAAGSLADALGEAAAAFRRQHGREVLTHFGPSGLLRQRIEAGERADVFASADLGHPRRLAEAGLAVSPAPLARNELCALAQPELGLTTDTLLETLLDAGVRLGTSTPGADPCGDYTWRAFRQAEAHRPGAYSTLALKARKLVGHPTAPRVPHDRNRYAYMLESGLADVLLTYRTNALVARKANPRLCLVPLPAGMAVGATYGLTVLRRAGPAADKLAHYLLSKPGQETLARYGFSPPGPTEGAEPHPARP